MLRPITHCILPQYLAYYILAPSSQQSLVEKSSGTTVAHVNLSDFRPYLIAVPPIDEQKRIVNKLKELLPLLDKYNCYADKLSRLNNEINTLLKKSILQEAIQGRLVPQIAEEGTAKELLEQIKAEKLVKESKLKKSALNESVIFRGDDNKYWEKSEDGAVCIDDEIPFEIPSNWAWVRLDDICSFIHRGKSPKYSPIKKYPVVAQKCNQWDGFSIEKAKFIEPQSISSYNEEYFLQDRDLMWNSTGLGTLGRMAIYYMILNPYELAVADSHVTVIRPYKTHIVSEYLYYYFASNTVQSVIEDKSDGSTKQKELATKTVKAYLVPIPPFAEQQRIVQKIKSVTSIDEFLPFQIPETWVWCKVKDLLEIQTGASFKKEQANANKKGIRILRGGNILPNKYIFKDDDVFVSEEFVNANTILKKNSIITPAVTSLENIGKMAVIEKDYKNVSAGGFVFIISPYIQDFNHSLLLAYFLQSPFLIEAMRGITKKSGAAFYNLGKERLKELYLPLPPMAEQGRIVGKINEVLSSIMSR